MFNFTELKRIPFVYRVLLQGFLCILALCALVLYAMYSDYLFPTLMALSDKQLESIMWFCFFVCAFIVNTMFLFEFFGKKED